MDPMRISNIMKTYGSYETEQPVKAPRTGRAKESRDTVALSSQAKDYQTTVKALSEISDIRYDKVNRIKAQMDKGTYSVDSSELADKMLAKLFTLGL